MPSEKADKEKDKDKAKTHKLSLKGSSKLVAEFFEYSINSILFQRGVYPPEDFSPVKKYGLNMLVSNDDAVRAYLKRIHSQLNKWMQASKIQKLVVVITSKSTGENVERWQFDVDIFSPPPKPSKSSSAPAAEGSGEAGGQGQENASSSTSKEKPDPKDEALIQSEIQSLFRQITASVTFLPQLTDPCTFNVLVYAAADSDVPVEWGDSDAKEINDGEKVQLRSWGTGLHSVGTSVAYRLGE